MTPEESQHTKAAVHGYPRVAHLTSVHLVNDVRIFQKECKSLFDAGYDVILVGNGESSQRRGEPAVVGLRRIRSRAARIILSWAMVLRCAIRTKASLFHLHDPELIIAGLMLKLLGKKVIFDCHEYYAEDMLDRPYIARSLRRVLAILVHASLKMADRCFDGIVVAAPGMLRNFANPNTIVLNNYPEWEIGSRQARSFTERAPVIAYVGSICERRGINEILAALDIVAKSTDVRLLLCGRPSPPELIDEIRSHPGWCAVDYRGLLPRAEMERLLEEAIAGLVIFWDISNHRESSPNKLFEYMAVGLPAIVTDFASWRTLLDPVGASLTVDPRDPESIAAKISWIIANRETAEQMGRRGQQAVREKFNWKCESKKLVALYSKLLSPGPSTST